MTAFFLIANFDWIIKAKTISLSAKIKTKQINMALFNEHSTVPTLLRNVVETIHKPEDTFLIHKKNNE